MKTFRFLMFIFSISLLVGFLGCGRTKKVEPQDEKQEKQIEKQKGSSWEQDMNKLIEKVTPKEEKK